MQRFQSKDFRKVKDHISLFELETFHGSKWHTSWTKWGQILRIKCNLPKRNFAFKRRKYVFEQKHISIYLMRACKHVRVNRCLTINSLQFNFGYVRLVSCGRLKWSYPPNSLFECTFIPQLRSLICAHQWPVFGIPPCCRNAYIFNYIYVYMYTYRGMLLRRILCYYSY